ncbi:S-layer protein [Cupriavidus malaysiensis]|uniref:S-layer protein n=1 Tax=Cupriavidus malaysiensis TaxID=367825 RepID=A0ABM6FD06_9BURK|nr:S-layer protein [Cupriavidus malaysiensis]AOZ09581.1 S-layer protein [Cupriavidus malaysiensis]
MLLHARKPLIGFAISCAIGAGLYACGGDDVPATNATNAGNGGGTQPTSPTTPPAPPTPVVQGRWTTGDLHVHTIQSNDAQTPLADVLDQAFGKYQLDWITLSNHLRVSDRDHTGAAIAGGSVAFSKGMALYEQPAVKQWQAAGRYAGKLILSATEWDMPTHDHMNIGIFAPSGGKLETAAKAVAKFEYLFTNRSDSLFDPVDVAAWSAEGPRSYSTHADALKAVAWLKANYPDTSYALINHPSRNPGKYTAANFRELHDLAPNQFFAIEGMVGGQLEPDRGGYTSAYTPENARSRTYGGVDYIVAQVGGIWDALLGEGRRIWNVANSDHHFEMANGIYSSSYYPGAYAKNYVWLKDGSAQSLLDGLRSGKGFAVYGDLINALDFTVSTGGTSREMGGELPVKTGDKVTLTIRFKSPERNNYEYPLGSGVSFNARPAVDHIDLIAGDVVERPKPGTPAYDKDTNDSTKVIATFTRADWKVDKDGYNTVTYTFTATGSRYFRLRGTNLGPDVAGETQGGNPLADSRTTIAEDQARFNAINLRNYSDLWFYSNPVFVRQAG